MAKTRSLAFGLTALLTAGATTAVCFGDALGVVPSRNSVGSAEAVSRPPITASSTPLDVLTRSGPWLSGANETREILRGKVVIVNFWTYSCINSLRALPYLKAWQKHYGDLGLEVVGVHSPEFAFEHKAENVRLAAAKLGVGFSNIQDNDFRIWKAFANEGWPGFYFIDAKGRMRGYQIGEGSYADSEQLIRRLLSEAGRDLRAVPLAFVRPEGIETQADWSNLGSPENYFGFAKAVGFRSTEPIRANEVRRYSPASALALNTWDLSGYWSVGYEAATVSQPGASIGLRYQARDANLVLGGGSPDAPIRFRVTLDGKAPGDQHGLDTDANGWGEVREDRLYQLIRQTASLRDRSLRIEFDRAGARAYSATYG